jgi:2-amino-4-hydroxy-6-hydroxymethyldihydropteridine diphosphokinase
MSAGQTRAYVGIGSNLGDSRANVKRAIEQLGRLPKTRLARQSSLFCTAPIEAEGDDYVNAVARLETGLSAQELLLELQALEHAYERERPYVNAPRTLDLDILLYGSEQIQTESLTVPHPRLTRRAFALIPLLQIDPMVAVPGAGPAHSFAPGVADQRIQRI